MNEPMRDEELSAMIAAAPRPRLDEHVLRDIHRRIDRELVRITIVSFSRWCAAAAAAILLIAGALLIVEANSDAGGSSSPLGEAIAVLQSPSPEAAETPVEIEIATWIAADLQRSDGD